MSLDFANFVSALIMLVAAIYAVQEASHFSRIYRVAPGLLAAGLCLMLADRGMDILNIELSSSEFIIRSYLTTVIRVLGAFTILSLVIAHKRCREGKIAAVECGYVHAVTK